MSHLYEPLDFTDADDRTWRAQLHGWASERVLTFISDDGARAVRVTHEEPLDRWPADALLRAFRAAR